jgi:hypothetical protein
VPGVVYVTHGTSPVLASCSTLYDVDTHAPTAGGIVIDLPDCSTNPRCEIGIFRVIGDTSGYVVNASPSGSQSINNNGSGGDWSLGTTPGSAATLVCGSADSSGDANWNVWVPSAAAPSGSLPFGGGATQGPTWEPCSGDLACSSSGAFTLGSAAHTLAQNGVLTVPNGGTGNGSVTANGLLYGNGTSALGVLAPGMSGYVLTTNGSGSAPSWVATAGTLPSGSNGQLLYNNGTSWVTSAGPSFTGGGIDAFPSSPSSYDCEMEGTACNFAPAPYNSVADGATLIWAPVYQWTGGNGYPSGAYAWSTVSGTAYLYEVTATSANAQSGLAGNGTGITDGSGTAVWKNVTGASCASSWTQNHSYANNACLDLGGSTGTLYWANQSGSGPARGR